MDNSESNCKPGNTNFKISSGGEVITLTKPNGEIADSYSAIIIPQKSTFEIQDKTFDFIVDKDNIIQMRAFKPGRRVAQYYIVEAGLKPGENIVYEGVQSIRQGVKIKPVKMNLDSLMKTALTIN